MTYEIVLFLFCSTLAGSVNDDASKIEQMITAEPIADNETSIDKTSINETFINETSINETSISLSHDDLPSVTSMFASKNVYLSSLITNFVVFLGSEEQLLLDGDDEELEGGVIDEIPLLSNEACKDKESSDQEVASVKPDDPLKDLISSVNDSNDGSGSQLTVSVDQVVSSVIGKLNLF